MNDVDSQAINQLLLFGQMLEFIAMIMGALAVVCLIVYLCSIILLCLGEARVRRSRAATVLPAACPETTFALPARGRITNGETPYAKTKT